MRLWTTNRLLIKSSVVAFILAGCSLPPSKNTPVARVNGDSIVLADYQELFETMRPKEIPAGIESKSELRNLVIKTLIRRQVILTEAKRKNIVVSKEELEEGLKNFKGGYTESSFEQQLSEEMIDEKVWRKNVEQGLLIEKLFDEVSPQIPPPTTQEAMEFFEKNRNLFQRKASARALHLVVGQEELAKELLTKIKKSPGDFARIAKENSTGPEAQEGAIIRVEKDTLPELLDEVLFNSKIGSISGVIRSPYGFHIIKVLERSPPLNQDFHPVKAEIMARLLKLKRQEWLIRFEERLIRSAQIEYNREIIETL